MSNNFIFIVVWFSERLLQFYPRIGGVFN